MTAAHQRLVNDMGMRMEHFDIVLEHLGASLEELKVPQVCHANTPGCLMPIMSHKTCSTDHLPLGLFND